MMVHVCTVKRIFKQGFRIVSQFTRPREIILYALTMSLHFVCTLMLDDCHRFYLLSRLFIATIGAVVRQTFRMPRGAGAA